jgi:diguanylate cyclase (GGDEF)-like protein/PAS domain S-box-containing protein
MVTASTQDGRPRTVSFDRVDPEAGDFPLHPFELSHDVDLSSDGVRTVTWVYDCTTDSVIWSRPVEEFFGFAPGVRGFAVHGVAVADGTPALEAGDAPDPGDAGATVETGETGETGAAESDGTQTGIEPAAEWNVAGPPVLDYSDPADIGEAMLAPILAPMRLGLRPADVDLRMTVTCPDGTDHIVVVRASPVGGADDSGQDVPAGLRDTLTGVVVDVTAHRRFARELEDLVDRYRLLTEVSPDVVIVHVDGILVYGNRAAVKAIGAKRMMDHYGEPMTNFVDPEDVGDVLDRLSQLTEPGQFFEHGEVGVKALDGSVTHMEITSIRTSWGGKPAFQVILRDVSERRAAEAAARYRASLVAHVSDAIIGIDADGKIESWNEAAQSIYGWTEAEVTGLPIGAVVGGRQAEAEVLLERGRHLHRRKDGSGVEVLVSIDPLSEEGEKSTGWVVVCTELTDARQAEAGRRAAEERYEAVVASLSEGIVLFDGEGNVCANNEAAARILGDRLTTGSGHEIFTGNRIAISSEGQPLSGDMFPHAATLATGESEDDVVIGVTDGTGHRQWLSLSSRLLSGAGQGEAPMVVCSFTDVTDRKAAEAQLHWLAYHDSLTGLGNRSFFTDELERELMVSAQRGSNLAVLFIDLDRFKLVNDSFGHGSGDEVLLELAQRFKSAIRAGDLVSRFSGDEFVVLCRNVRDVQVAVSMANEYTRLLAEPVLLSTGRSVEITSSVGVSFVMRGRESAQDTIKQADAAMFQAKDKGGARVEVFDDSLRAKTVARLEIYDDLRHSIDNNELTVHYQPIASLKDDRIVAMEALVRWHHPSRGLLGPMEFIPFAEETDLIFKLGRYVLREACQTMAAWRRDLPGAQDSYVTVNLSAHQLSDPELLDSISGALEESGLPPEALVMEVTESILMSDTSTSIAMLGGIHEMGVGLAIDDFGTGYSSLAQLKRFPVKIVKIDKSFVDGLGTFDNDEAIVAAIVQLSKALDLVVLAEGVETPVQLQRVTELGCDLYQGYLLARPVQADKVRFNAKPGGEPGGNGVVMRRRAPSPAA